MRSTNMPQSLTPVQFKRYAPTSPATTMAELWLKILHPSRNVLVLALRQLRVRLAFAGDKTWDWRSPSHPECSHWCNVRLRKDYRHNFPEWALSLITADLEYRSVVVTAAQPRCCRRRSNVSVDDFWLTCAMGFSGALALLPAIPRPAFALACIFTAAPNLRVLLLQHASTTPTISRAVFAARGGIPTTPAKL